MKTSLQVTKWGGPQNLKLITEGSEPLTPGSVRIEVKACGVNFADIVMRTGSYPEAPRLPFTPGYEIAGTVMEVGSEVRTLNVGDRVLAGTRFGGYTSETVLPEFQVKKIPGNLSETEAAAIPVNFLTAWVALYQMARIQKGDRVLVQSAAGGVGIAALQIAREVGAHCVGLVSSESKFATIQSFGASEAMTYKDWDSLSDQEGGGFDIILDSQGGESFKRSYRRLAPTGRVVTFGVSSLVSGNKQSLLKLISLFYHTSIFTPYKLMMDNKGIFGLNMLPLFADMKPNQPSLLLNALDLILEKFRTGAYSVKIGKVFPLAQGGEAHSHLQSRENSGKVILTP